jgi:DNA-binding YbaB/EbfC family protein
MLDPKKLMEMQKNLMGQFEDMQAERESQEFDGTAGGGVVTCKVNGNSELLDLVIQPEAVDPDDIELLQDLVVAAINSALTKAREAGETDMSKLTGGLKLPPFLTGGM